MHSLAHLRTNLRSETTHLESTTIRRHIVGLASNPRRSVTVGHGRRIVLFVFIVRVFIHFPYVEGYKKKNSLAPTYRTRWYEAIVSLDREFLERGSSTLFLFPGQRPGYRSIEAQIKRKDPMRFSLSEWRIEFKSDNYR